MKKVASVIFALILASASLNACGSNRVGCGDNIVTGAVKAVGAVVVGSAKLVGCTVATAGNIVVGTVKAVTKPITCTKCYTRPCNCR